MSKGIEGEQFLASFAKLKSLVTDTPSKLEEKWESYPLLQNLCDEIAQLVRGFEIVEDWSRFAFTNNVSAAATVARRDYDDRWRSIITQIANRHWNEIFAGIFTIPTDDVPQLSDKLPTDSLGDEISDWKYEAKEESEQIEHLVNFAFQQREADEWGDLSWIEDSINAWNRLKAVCGLDVEGSLWRRRALPHVLIPSHVAKHYGAKRASLYRRMHQAGNAFVFGAPLAALALQRAVIEEVLARHWGAEKGKIREANLPALQWDARADRLKRLANDALHGDPEKLTSDQLDRAIIENFGLLRLLIEQAPVDIGVHQQKLK